MRQRAGDDAGRPGVYVALGLAGLAGFVDALGFLSLGGLFVSFMSGNTTQLGTRIARGDAFTSLALVLVPAVLIALFVAGVIGGTVVRRKFARHWGGVVMVVVALLLLGGAVSASFGSLCAAVAFTALAMGVENTVLVVRGNASLGVTYVTGTLVKLGQALGERLLGDRSDTWIFEAALWGCLATGAVLGAMAYAKWQLDSLWAAFAVSLPLVVMAWRAEAGTTPR